MQFTEQNTTLATSVLSSFVPMQSFNDAQLKVLVREIHDEYLYAGQSMVDNRAFDGCLVYLLSGSIDLVDEQGHHFSLHDQQEEAYWPLPKSSLSGCEIRAQTDSVLLMVNAQLLDDMLCWSQAATHTLLQMASIETLREEQLWLLTLADSGLFYRVPAMNMSRVIQSFDLCLVEPEEVIVKQGEAGDYCYVLREGYADVVKQGQDDGEPRCIAVLEPGDCFGEDAFIHSAPRNASVVMRSPGIVMRLARKDFFELLKPPLANSVPVSRALMLSPQPMQWIDVRTQAEFDAGHMDGALHIPLDLLGVKTRLLDPALHYACYCNTGKRAQAVSWFLQDMGYKAAAVDASLAQVVNAFSDRPLDISPAARGLFALSRSR